MRCIINRGHYVLGNESERIMLIAHGKSFFVKRKRYGSEKEKKASWGDAG